MAEALGDITKSQVDRLFKAGMPRHSAEAARAWRLQHLELSRTADSRIDRPQTSAPHNPPAAEGGMAAAPGGDSSSPPGIPDDDDAAVDENTAAYRADRARNERIKADRAELELARERGALVPVREVEQLEFTAGRITRDRVLMVPARLSAEVHALMLSLVPEELRDDLAKRISTHELERRLDDALRTALAEASKAIEDARSDDDDADD